LYCICIVLYNPPTTEMASVVSETQDTPQVAHGPTSHDGGAGV
jgi:hypothetical protein